MPFDHPHIPTINLWKILKLVCSIINGKAPLQSIQPIWKMHVIVKALPRVCMKNTARGGVSRG